MASQPGPFARALPGLFVVGATLFGLYAFVGAVVDRLSAMDSDIGKALVAAAATILAATFAVVSGKVWERRTARKREIYERKIDVYEKQVSAIFKILRSEKTGEEVEDGETERAFMEFTEKLMIWGGPKVIKAWLEFRLGASDSGPLESLERFATFMLALRSELGNSNSGITKSDLLGLFVNDYEEAVATGKAAGVEESGEEL